MKQVSLLVESGSADLFMMVNFDDTSFLTMGMKDGDW